MALAILDGRVGNPGPELVWRRHLITKRRTQLRQAFHLYSFQFRVVCGNSHGHVEGARDPLQGNQGFSIIFETFNSVGFVVHAWISMGPTTRIVTIYTLLSQNREPDHALVNFF